MFAGDSEAKPFVCFNVVPGHTVAVYITYPKHCLPLRVSLLSGLLEPFDGLRKILWNALTPVVGPSDLHLRFGQTLFSSFAVPFERLREVLGNALSNGVASTETKLTQGVPLFRTQGKELNRSGIV
jgi:hypothetical protein